RGFTALQALRSSLAPSTVAPTAEQNGRADAVPEEPTAPERLRRGGGQGERLDGPAPATWAAAARPGTPAAGPRRSGPGPRARLLTRARHRRRHPRGDGRGAHRADPSPPAGPGAGTRAARAGAERPRPPAP